jgi:hypothetical protein
MENIESKDSLENSISKVLNSTKLKKNKSCKDCDNENNITKKKCRSCNQIKKKLTPYILISVGVFFFMVYGIYKVVTEIISAFTQ